MTCNLHNDAKILGDVQTSRIVLLWQSRLNLRVFKPYLTSQREAIKSMIIKSEAFLQFRKYSQYRNTTMIHRSVTFLIVIFFVFLESSKHDSRKDLNNGKKHSENIEANGLQIKTARITVRALCYVISISSIGYLLFLIRQMITNFNNSFDNSVSESTEKTNRSSISSSTSAQHQTKKDEMIDCLKDINRLYLKSLFDPLAISGIMNISYIT